MNKPEGSGKQLVAVDEDSIFLTTLGLRLNGSQIAYHPFNKAADAGEHLKQQQPQWLLVDYRTSPGNGFSIIEKLFTKLLSGDTQVFIMSSEVISHFNIRSEMIDNCQFLFKDWMLRDDNLQRRLLPGDTEETSNRFSQLMRYAA